jgi:heparinase II/III-like protein
MLKRIAVLLVCALAGADLGAAEVRRGHPRIYVTSADLPALRARCAGPLKQLYRDMDKARWILKQRAKASWSDSNNVGYPAFKYLIGGEKKYLAKTKDYLEALVRTPPKNQYLTPEWIRSGCMAADWVWNDLTPAERSRYGRALIGMAEWVLKKVWRHSDFSNHFVNEHLSVVYVAVLLDGERIEPRRVRQLMTTGRTYLLKHAMPAANEVAGKLNRRPWRKSPLFMQYLEHRNTEMQPLFFVGGQPEGFSYNDWGYARPLALTCEMWRVATGEDLFKRSSFFRGQSLWHAYALRPDTGTFARSEDCPSGYKPGGNLKTFMHIVAARLDDPLAEWLAQKYAWKYEQQGWKEILWRNLKLKAKSPRELKLPLAACFSKLGHVYFRSAWGRKDAAFALFQCGPFYAGHQHLDNNTFVIHKLGSLAIDSGTNDYTSHRANYYARTVAHNGVLVFDPTETFGGRVWGAGGAGGSNDGGQMRARGVSRVGQWKLGGPSDLGRITRFVNGKHFAMCVGDATRSYSPKKVKKAVRTFYHLRAGPDDKEGAESFVIHDRIVPVRPGLKATWVIHSIEKPVVTGSGFTITHGDGMLLGQVLRPKRAALRVVGGPGKESLVNGKNYPPTGKKPDREAGGWRIEIPFKSTAVIVLTAVRKGSKLKHPRIASRNGKPGLSVPNGRLNFSFTGDIDKALPRLRVFDAKTVKLIESER